MGMASTPNSAGTGLSQGFEVASVSPGDAVLVRGFHPVHLVVVQREGEDVESALAALLDHGLQGRHFRTARAVPGRPELDQHDRVLASESSRREVMPRMPSGTLAPLWYFPTMRPRPLDEPLGLPPDPVASASVATARRTSLAAIHAGALYRPTPPVELDDDGYPHRDGAHAQSCYHGSVRAYLGSTMRARYAHRQDVLVAVDQGFFFEQGNPSAVVAPDLMVVFGAPDGDRLSYKLWEEPKVPDFALEVLSNKTWQKDVEVKPGLYRDLGVREFWTLDVFGKLPDQMTGFRMNSTGAYEPIPALPSGGYASEVLGLELLEYHGSFRFRDMETGRILPDYTESERLRKAAEARAKAADAEAKAAEARAKAADAEAKAAEARAKAADAEAKTAEAQAKAAEHRIAELEEVLRRSRRT